MLINEGDLIDERFLVESEIGSGGMGIVYKVIDESENVYALKILSPVYAQESEYAARFKREASIASGLHHQHVMKVYEIGVDEKLQLPFYLMEFASGLTLEHKLKNNRSGLPIAECEKIFLQICEAISFLHSKDIVHLDLKPSNILFDEDDNLFVSDFGLARVLQDSKYEEEVMAGTREYMSPEQINGDGVNKLSDIFSLGILLHEMLTGIRPRIVDFFKGTREISYQIPQDLQLVIMRAVQPLDSRYPSVIDFRRAFINRSYKKQPIPGDGMHPSLPSPWPVFLPDKQDLPFDLGMTWGLERGSFLGIVAGSKKDIHFFLHRVERVLYEELEREPSLRLPERWWIQVNWAASPFGPREAKDIWALAIPREDRFVDYLITETYPQSTIVGLILKVPCSDFLGDPDYIVAIKLWCQRLLLQIFPQSALAIIIQVVAESVGEALPVAQTIYQKCQTWSLNVAIELFVEFDVIKEVDNYRIIKENNQLDKYKTIYNEDKYLVNIHELLVRYFNTEELKTLCFTLDIDFDNLEGEGKESKARELILLLSRHQRINELRNQVCKQRPSIKWPNKSLLTGTGLSMLRDYQFPSSKPRDGWYFLSWVSKIVEVTSDPGVLPAEVVKISHKLLGTQVVDLEPVTAQPNQVVQDLDWLADQYKLNLEVHFLPLVAHYLPDHMPELLKALNRSQRGEAIFQAFRWAIKKSFWLDAWVDGFIEKEGFPDIAIQGNAEEGPLLPILLLALIRRLRMADSQNVKEKIQYLSQKARKELRGLCAFALGEISSQEFLNSYGIVAFSYAWQAQFHLFYDFSMLDLETADHWWLVFISTPRPELIRHLLLLPPEKRIVVGLCHAQERNRLLRDIGLVNFVEQCRWYRPVIRE